MRSDDDALGSPHGVRVDGGRLLAYSDLGDPDGFPVINCHGGLVNRLDIAPAHGVARQHGIRILSPDRPGIGASAPAPGRRLLDWPKDVAALADALRIERFAVLGWSMGGQYALACARALPARVTRAALVASCVPLDDPARRAELNRMDDWLARLAVRAPRAMRALLNGTGRFAERFPELFTRLSALQLGAADAEVLGFEPADHLARPMHEGLSNPQGVVEDYRVMIAPWGFRPEDVRMPVDVWQGTDDVYVPAAWGEMLARRIPNATLHRMPGEGHMLAHRHYGEIFDRLVPRA